MSDEQPTAKETARQARRLLEEGNNQKVPAEKQAQYRSEAKALTSGQGA